ncbi:pentatricopeptide repeat-containing protein [Spatholobus suberectus]|nr:pentatricopeptide repeat-containing protein [Spatholobus suberectus]
MFVSCNLLGNACHRFDKMLVRDFNSWATLLVNAFQWQIHDPRLIGYVAISSVDMGLPSQGLCLNVCMGMQVHGLLLKLGSCDHVLLSSCGWTGVTRN